MKVKKFMHEVIPGFEMNSYLVMERDHALLVDPGILSEKLLETLKNITLDAVVLTHAHFDHILGLNDLDVPIYLSNKERDILVDPEKNYAKVYGRTLHVERFNLRDIQTLPTWQGIKLEVIETPGHTKGSICIKLEDHLFSGDTLFVDTVGRTDLATGSASDLQKSLKLFQKLSNNTIVYPGHGGSAKLKKIKEMNPYLS